MIYIPHSFATFLFTKKEKKIMQLSLCLAMHLIPIKETNDSLQLNALAPGRMVFKSGMGNC